MRIWRVAAALFLVGVCGFASTPAASADTLLVTNFSSDNVSVIDTATNAVVGSPIPVGDEPIAIAITPDGTRAYVSNQGSDTVSVIDIPNRTTVGAPISVPEVGSIAVSPDGSKVYVYSGSFVKTIDTFTNTLDTGGIYDMNSPSGAAGIALTPDASQVWVAHTSPNNWVFRLQTDGSRVGGEAPQTSFVNTSFSGPNAIAFRPDGSRGYVASDTGAGVVPVETATGAAGQAIPDGLSHARAIAITPDGSRAYVPGDDNDSHVNAVDLTTNSQVTPTTFLPAGPVHLRGVAITPDGSRAYFSGGVLPDPGKVVGVSIPTGEPVGPPIDVGLYPGAMAIAPNLVPPTARLAQPVNAIAGLPASFDAGASSDPDGTIARYGWNFGDGRTAANAGPQPHHTYKAGTYTASVTVTDNQGCSFVALYTGQTAYCRGSAGARASRTVVVRGIKRKATRRNLGAGTAVLSIEVPIGGDLQLQGAGLVKQHRTPGRAGVVPLKVAAKGAKLRKLRRTGRVAVHPSVIFRPKGGVTERRSYALKLRLKRRSS